jgi:hypothetical protein
MHHTNIPLLQSSLGRSEAIVLKEANEVQQPAMKKNTGGNIRRKNSALLVSLVIRPAGSIVVLLSARVLAILAWRFLQVVVPAAQLIAPVLGQILPAIPVFAQTLFILRRQILPALIIALDVFFFFGSEIAPAIRAVQRPTGNGQR